MINKILVAVLVVAVAAFVAYYMTLTVKDSVLTHEDEAARKELPVEGALFKILVKQGDVRVDAEAKTITYSGAEFELKPELMLTYYKIGLLNQSQNSVVVYPGFTEAAYSENGFYDYYKNECGTSCLTVKIPDEFSGEYSASRAAFNSLRLLGYQYVTDADIDRNPEILKKYDKVILLHNEYVTKKEFDAITDHPKVIYLYPNALFAEINVDYLNNSITLVRGHGYPDLQIRNGFEWKFDNTDFEYDNECKNWKFYEIDNGVMLNCYPEYIIFKDQRLLESIKNY